MREIIHPSVQDHAPAGKGHDLPDSRPVIIREAMDTAPLAGWFRLKRAVEPLCHGVFRNCRAFTAKKSLPHGYFFNPDIRFDLIAMFRPAVYTDEVEQEFQIFNLCAGELFHGCMVAEKARESYDAGQKSSLLHSRE